MSAFKYIKNYPINFNKIKKENRTKNDKMHKFIFNSFSTRTHKNTITNLNINTIT